MNIIYDFSRDSIPRKLFAIQIKENLYLTPNEFFKEDQKICSIAYFKDQLNETGWDKLFIETFRVCHPNLQLWSAGLLEGALTYKKIENFYLNLHDLHFKKHPEEISWILSFFEKFEKQKRNINKNNQFFKTLQLLEAQVSGLMRAYNNFSNMKLSLAQFYLLNADGQITELIRVARNKITISNINKNPKDYRYKLQKKNKFNINSLFQNYHSKNINNIWLKILKSSHCSSFIKLIKTNGKINNILIAHSTWGSYSEMLRIFKRYEFDVRNIESLGKIIISFSSYPGCISSTDDFYILGKKIIIMETTLEILNEKLFSKISFSDKYIPDFFRISISNMLAISGKNWIEWFSYVNTGTYNSQWMIIDLNKFKNSKGGLSLSPETFYVFEQIPGNYKYEDMSNHLDEKGYWASYNIPYYSYNDTEMGFKTIYKKFHAKNFNYYDNIRARIFEKKNDSVTDIATLKQLMLFNDWRKPNNEFSKRPSDSLAARYDLEEGTMQQLYGAVDVKLTNYYLGKENNCEIINGPAHFDQPIFTFGKFPDSIKRGLPEIWNFEWEKINKENLIN